MKIWKKRKKHPEISSFYISVLKIMIIGYTIPEIWNLMDVIAIFRFGLFFTLKPPNSPKNENFKKIKKNSVWRYHHFAQMYQKSWSYATVPEIWQVMDVIVTFHFGLFLALLPVAEAPKMKIHKWKFCYGKIVLLAAYFKLLL